MWHWKSDASYLTDTLRVFLNSSDPFDPFKEHCQWFDEMQLLLLDHSKSFCLEDPLRTLFAHGHLGTYYFTGIRQT